MVKPKAFAFGCFCVFIYMHTHEDAMRVNLLVVNPERDHFVSVMVVRGVVENDFFSRIVDELH